MQFSLRKFPVDVMNSAKTDVLVNKLPFPIRPRPRKIKNGVGPQVRLDKMRKTVTALIKHERIELHHFKADEARGYAERLISEAIRHGDCHKETMDQANYWLLEKELVHKLFKVLVPRFESATAYTRMHRAPTVVPGFDMDRAVLELRGNPFPSLTQDTTTNRLLIHNVLLEGAKYHYRHRKYQEVAKKISDAANTETSQQTTEQVMPHVLKETPENVAQPQ